MQDIDFQHLASGLTMSAHRAGARIMDHYGRAEVELKGDASPVTAADREADAILLESLAQLAPGIPVISEESSPTLAIVQGERFFLVDPLDGTKEFINARSEFTVNVAMIENAKPVFGLVYAPALSRLYLTPGTGGAVSATLEAKQPAPEYAALEFKPISTRPPSGSGLTAAVSRSHLDRETEAFLGRHDISETLPSGSSLKFCCLAEGLADVYPRYGRTMEWDTAAGHAVLLAAGGVVLDENGAALGYGKCDDGYANPGFVAWGRAP